MSLIYFDISIFDFKRVYGFRYKLYTSKYNLVFVIQYVYILLIYQFFFFNSDKIHLQTVKILEANNF